MWYDNFKVGDKVAFDHNVRYRKTGNILYAVLTDRLLANIKKYEDESNFHNFRIV